MFACSIGPLAGSDVALKAAKVALAVWEQRGKGLGWFDDGLVTWLILVDSSFF
jgi:hypothetical protein